MRIMLTSRIDNEDALALADSLADLLIQQGHEVIYESNTASCLGKSGVPLPEASADLLVVVGGDGTVLLAIQQLKRQVPIIGVNWGEVGFLTDLEPDEAIGFFTNLSDNIQIEKRMRITLSIDGTPLGDALNEAVIVTARPAKMLRFSVIVDGTPAETFRGDGLLISTPTGSTAYAMSAGGPIVDPRIEGFLLVPLAPYMLSSRPHLISSDRSVDIRLESVKPAKLVIDGQMTWDLRVGSVIRIKRSQEPALFVDVGKNFFAKVDNKLRHL
ncbi:MAG TPA: NAD(+)/NADH kinase [Methanomicrobiales archaeon]|nr:NAD(+)/NADH kinase [Methanomicrobiales archaeon]